MTWLLCHMPKTAWATWRPNCWVVCGSWFSFLLLFAGFVPLPFRITCSCSGAPGSCSVGDSCSAGSVGERSLGHFGIEPLDRASDHPRLGHPTALQGLSVSLVNPRLVSSSLARHSVFRDALVACMGRLYGWQKEQSVVFRTATEGSTALIF